MLVVVPGADESIGVEPSRQQIGRLEHTLAAAVITGEAVADAGGNEPHEADVVVQMIKFLKRFVQHFLRALSFRAVGFLAGMQIHLPHGSRPETVSPPADPIKGAGLPLLLTGGVRKIVKLGCLLAGEGHLRSQLCPHILRESLMFCNGCFETHDEVLPTFST